MTDKQRRVIAESLRRKTRIVEIEPLHRFTAAVNLRKERGREAAAQVTRLLEAEQRRLIRTWND